MTNLGWKEWVDETISIQVGCENNCSYCWARVWGLQKGYVSDWEDWKNPRSKKQKDCLKKKYGVVGYPGTHDIHESNLYESVEVVRELVRNGNKVIIVTKGKNSIVTILVDELKNYHLEVEFRFSISTNYDGRIKKFEGKSPLYKEKKLALEWVSKMGFRTSVSMEPYISANLVDVITDLKELVNTKTFYVGVMNYRETIKKHFPEIVELDYLYTIGTRLKIKEELDQLKDVVIRYKNEEKDWRFVR